jgi:hypothetical protein
MKLPRFALRDLFWLLLVVGIGCGSARKESASVELPVIRIDELSSHHYLDHGGINGSELEGRTGAAEAYDANLAFLLRQMETVGTLGIGEGDYYIDRYASPDFFPCVEVSDARILTPALTRAVCIAVAQMEPEYRVDFCNAWGYLDQFGFFNVFVEHDRIYVYAQSNELVKMLGLDAETFVFDMP